MTVHCMMDLETWGRKPGCAIRSIGAAVFELPLPIKDRLKSGTGQSGGIGREFYLNISDVSCLRSGLRVDDETADWWKAHPEAEKLLTDAQEELATAVEAFHQFFRDEGCEFIWSHGCGFDIPIWEAACDAVPWKFRNVRDTRTWYAAHGFNPRSVLFTGVRHNALDDARYQAQCVIQAAL